MSETILITGTNRGIGLALTEEFLRRGARVFATCRHPHKASALKKLRMEFSDLITIVRMDVTSDREVAAAADRIRGKTSVLNLLINNAGIYAEPSLNRITPLAELDFATCREAFEVNVLGALRVTRAFLQLVEKSHPGRIVNISSGLGSVGEKTTPGYYAYGTSKAALNYVTRALAEEIRGRNLILTAIDPGSVRTDMGSVNSKLTAAESAAGIVAIVSRLTEVDNSAWYNWEGKKCVW